VPWPILIDLNQLVKNLFGAVMTLKLKKKCNTDDLHVWVRKNVFLSFYYFLSKAVKFTWCHVSLA